MDRWQVIGDWHKVTIDTNTDLSSGLDGELAIDCAGSYTGGIMETNIKLYNYGEITFEFYVQNFNEKNEPNYLRFYIDNSVKLEIEGPSPWRQSQPIGITPGEHKLKFEYRFLGTEKNKKGIVDSITIYEGRDVNCIVNKASPPKPSIDLKSNKTLRGYTRFQEMTAYDTEINFTALFNGIDFLQFLNNIDRPIYFIDEFGICYRGIVSSTPTAESIALNELYSIQTNITAPQKAGIGFC